MSAEVPAREVPTAQGLARVHRVGDPACTRVLALGHGAGGGVWSPDLQALRVVTEHGWTLLLVEQPWRVAGRRVATAPARLDAAWRELLPQVLPGRPGDDGLLVVGGRSAGARVACRTCPGQDPLPPADGVLALAFPLRPPGRPGADRAHELAVPAAHGIPTLVVQGERDPFGGPGDVLAATGGQGVEVVAVPGTHSPTPDGSTLVEAVLAWLGRLADGARRPRALP